MLRISRPIAVLMAIATLAIPAVPFIGAATAQAETPHVTGPPLGYYYTELRTCQKNHLFYERVCKQADIIVSNANNPCYELTDAGIVLSGLAIINGWDAWATLAFVSASAILCQVV